MKYLLVFEIGVSSFEDAQLGLTNVSLAAKTDQWELDKGIFNWNFSTFPNLQCIEEVSELTKKGDDMYDSLDAKAWEFGGND